MFDLSATLEGTEGKLIEVAFHDLENGRDYFLNADESLHPASTIKVHVMMEVFHQAQAGKFSLDDSLPLTNAFTSLANGSPFALLEEDDAEQTLYPLIGQSISIRELTRLMIVRSSNLATNTLIEKVGAQNVNNFIQALDIPDVILRRGVEDNVAYRLGINNSATARGLTQTMKLIAEKKVVSEEASEEMIQILLRQELNESLPALLPNSVKVAHKTGWTGEVYHDTGILYPEHRRPYVLSLMTRGFAEDHPDEAHACMATISKMIYEQLP